MHMKPLFFFILFFVSVFITFTSPAQFPLPGHDGYRKYYPNSPDLHIEVRNSRNEFHEYSENHTIPYWKDYGTESEIVETLFDGHKTFYNGRYYYSTYKENNKYYYRILIYSEVIGLFVGSRYNDSEFIQCKHMLDKEANRIIRNHGYKYDEPN